MNVVFIVPTGLGAEIGGNAGDATPAAKLIASLCCDFITHPNVVNASDINEMPENTLYVDGMMLDNFLEEKVCLKKVRQNKILLVTNPPLRPETVNSVNAARAVMGADIDIMVLKEPLTMVGHISDNKAAGAFSGVNLLVDQVSEIDYDALAVHTPIEVDPETKMNYYKNGGVNPWGGIEALVSRAISRKIQKPVAHAPIECFTTEEERTFNEVIDPRASAEMVSVSYLHCVLKGLHKAPVIAEVGEADIWARNIDALISPFGVWDRPHMACDHLGIPIIMVKSNKISVNEDVRWMDGKNILIADNYFEAAGYLCAMKAGVTIQSITRPLLSVKIYGDAR